jgi:hypothetical protein
MSWPFHRDYYNEKTAQLPKSVINELIKRMTTLKRDRVDIDDIAEKNPVIEVKLNALVRAYNRKKHRTREKYRSDQILKAAASSSSDSEEESSEQGNDVSSKGLRVSFPEKKIVHSEFDAFMAELRKLKT